MKKLLCYFSLMLLLAQSSYGQQTFHVGLPRDYFGFYAADQVGSGWCWAASLQMIFNHYGVYLDQQKIINRIFSNHPGNDLSNWEDSLRLIQSNIKKWTINENVPEAKVRASLTIGPPTALFLIDELTNLRPVLIGYRSGTNHVRALIVTACNYTQTQEGFKIQEIEVRDPHPSKQNIANSGRVDYVISDLDRDNLIIAFWNLQIEE